MEEEILENEDDLEEDINDLEEESKVKVKKQTTKTPIAETNEEPTETWEGFMQPARLGIVNTTTGELIEGFEPKKDEGIIQLGKEILNKLTKLEIAQGI